MFFVVRFSFVSSVVSVFMRGVNGVFYLSRKRKYEKTSDFTLPEEEKCLETLNLASNRPAGSRKR